MLEPGMQGLGIGCFVIAIIIQCMILCCRAPARKVPLNYILLGIFTLCFSFFTAVITARYPTETVLTAAGATTLVTVALTIYACTTKTDFTTCGALLTVLFMTLFFVCISMIFFTFAVWWHPIIAGLFVIIYGFYIIYDTQLIAGGRKHELSLDDYVIGALLLYIDIIMLFLELLRLFGSD